MQPAGVQYILDTVVQALQANPARKFIYSEMVGGAGARRGGGEAGRAAARCASSATLLSLLRPLADALHLATPLSSLLCSPAATYLRA